MNLFYLHFYAFNFVSNGTLGHVGLQGHSFKWLRYLHQVSSELWHMLSSYVEFTKKMHLCKFYSQLCNKTIY